MSRVLRFLDGKTPILIEDDTGALCIDDDPGIPTPDGTIRLLLAATTVVTCVIEAGRWYWVYVPNASDVFIKFGASVITAVDHTKNCPIPPGIYNPMTGGDYTHVGVSADATSGAYVYLIPITRRGES